MTVNTTLNSNKNNFNYKHLGLVFFIAGFSILFIIKNNITAYGLYFQFRSIFLRADSLQIIDDSMGNGEVAQKGDEVIVDYEAFVYNYKYAPKEIKSRGQKFDSTLDRHKPLIFTIGYKQVPPGLEMAVVGMKPGGHRYVIMPPSLSFTKIGGDNRLVPTNQKLFLYSIQLKKLISY